jgi:predicted nicotinamide N-methyase
MIEELPKTSLLLDQIEFNLRTNNKNTSAQDLAFYRCALLLDSHGSCDDKQYDYSCKRNSNSNNKKNRNNGFPALFVPVLNRCIQDFIRWVQQQHQHQQQRSTKPSENLKEEDNCNGNCNCCHHGNSSCGCCCCYMEVVTNVTRSLRLYRQIARLDPTLNDEIGKEGAHHGLSQLMKLDITTLDCCNCHGNHDNYNYSYNVDVDNDDDNNSNNNDNDNDDIHQDWGELNQQDIIMEVQDLAGEIASLCQSFPVAATPLTPDQLRARLPLIFEMKPSMITTLSSNSHHIMEDLTILIHQVTTRQSAQRDVGFVMWPSAVVLAQWLIDHPELTRQKSSILELGAGCGLVGLVAAKQLQQQQQHDQGSRWEKLSTGRPTVILSDFNETVVQNLTRNLQLNGLQNTGVSKRLDFFQQDPTNNGWLSMDGEWHPQVDLILASDVICQPEDAFAVVRTIASALKDDGMAIIVSANAKHRFGIEQLEDACQGQAVTGGSGGEYCLTLTRQHVNNDVVLYHHILSAMAKTSGFVNGMALTMYTITKKKKVRKRKEKL